MRVFAIPRAFQSQIVAHSTTAMKNVERKSRAMLNWNRIRRFYHSQRGWPGQLVVRVQRAQEALPRRSSFAR